MFMIHCQQRGRQPTNNNNDTMVIRCTVVNKYVQYVAKEYFTLDVCVCDSCGERIDSFLLLFHRNTTHLSSFVFAYYRLPVIVTHR